MTTTLRATDKRSKMLRKLAPIVGDINRHMRATAHQLEETMIGDYYSAPYALSPLRLENWIGDLEYVASYLRQHRDFLLGPRALTERGEVAARQIARRREGGD